MRPTPATTRDRGLYPRYTIMTFHSGMKIRGSYWSTAPVAFLLLTACATGGSQQQLPSPGAAATVQSGKSHGLAPAGILAMTTALHVVPKVRYDHHRSWMKPEAKHTQYLLYVSDEAAGKVDVYAYRSRQGHMVGQLNGFTFPYGECQDGAGNIYIADFGASQIVEYAHGGTSPIKTLSDAYGYPIGCSVNPVTGDLAVANFEGISSTCMGGIVLYAGAEGSGTYYGDPDFIYFYPPGYDPNGNLYVQGQNASGASGLAMLPADDSGLMTLSVSGATVNFPGGALWDGKHIALTDQQYQDTHSSGAYDVDVAGSVASVVSSVEFTDNECLKDGVPYNDTVQPFLNGTARPFHAIVGGNLACSYRYNAWRYLVGGDPKRSLPYDAAPELASGQVVSAMARN